MKYIRERPQSAHQLCRLIREKVPEKDQIRVDIDANCDFCLWIPRNALLMAIENQTVKEQPRPFALCKDEKGFFVSSTYFESDEVT